MNSIGNYFELLSGIVCAAVGGGMEVYMMVLCNMIMTDLKRRSKDGFIIGYNIIFPVILILLLGYLTSGSYGKTFTGYHYYSVVMIPFCIAMSIITAAYAGKDDAYKKTAVRFLFAPISKAQIVLAKLFSLTLLISICNLLVLIFAKVLLRLPIGREIVLVFLVLTAESFLISAIGLWIGLGMKNFILIKNILNIPIMLAAILAGVFYPIGTLNSKLEIFLRLSPLTWLNRGIFHSIYDGDDSLLFRVGIVLISLGLVFMGLTINTFKKEEFIYGDLPGYDK